MDTRAHAQAIATTVPQSVGFDPITIVTILTQVLPLIVGCFRRNDEADPAEIKAAVIRQNASRPQALQRRTARRIRGEADHPMSREQATALAVATINHCMNSDDGEVAAYCAEVAE